MYLSKGEFTQFSLKGRIGLLNEFGTFLKHKHLDEIRIEIYLLYGFFVEVLYCNEDIVEATPVRNMGLLSYY
jgi:hypothetical protein